MSSSTNGDSGASQRAGAMPRSPLRVVVPALATETPRAEKFEAAPKLIVVVAALAVFSEIALEIDTKTRRLRVNDTTLAYLSLRILALQYLFFE
jgi:hypothetical protein